MGVSLLWLGLVDEAVAELPPEKLTDDDLLAEYRAADERNVNKYLVQGRPACLPASPERRLRLPRAADRQTDALLMRLSEDGPAR